MVSPLNPHPNAHPSAGAYSNAHQIAVELTNMGVRAASRAVTITRHYGMLLETRIKAKASGRPGPRAITGNYRRSWSTQIHTFGGAISAIVGTNAPQGRRLEYGFVGADRTGRVFNQPPFPHAGPAADEVLPLYEVAIGELLTLGGD